MYKPPTFNLTCGIILGDSDTIPGLVTPDYTGVACQKYINKVKGGGQVPGFWTDAQWFVEWRFPKQWLLDNLGDDPQSWGVSFIQYPEGGSYYWRPGFLEWKHEGFPNQYGIMVGDKFDQDGNIVRPANIIQQYPPYQSVSWPRP